MNPPPVDASLYDLSASETELFKRLTGIESDEDLKQHICEIRDEAYKICPYPCIRFFSYTSMRLTRHWVYEDVLKLGKAGDDNFFLDIGCCMGTDVRKLVVDGYPPNKVIASDLCSEFWDIGKKLFKADVEGDKIRFIQEDITKLDPKALENMSSPDNTLAAPNTLSDLHQRCSVIHVSYVFHFFSKEQQYNLARTLASLLSPKPGSIIFGAQVGLAEAGERTSAMGYKTFGQCPLSWKELWVGEGGVFSADAAECEAKLFEPEPKDAITPNPIDKKPYLLKWSVKRLH